MTNLKPQLVDPIDLRCLGDKKEVLHSAIEAIRDNSTVSPEIAEICAAALRRISEMDQANSHAELDAIADRYAK